MRGCWRFDVWPDGDAVVAPGAHPPELEDSSGACRGRPRFESGNAVGVAARKDKEPALLREIAKLGLVLAAEVASGLHDFDEVDQAGEAFDLVSVHGADEEDDGRFRCVLVHVACGIAAADGGIEVGSMGDVFFRPVGDEVEGPAAGTSAMTFTSPDWIVSQRVGKIRDVADPQSGQLALC